MKHIMKDIFLPPSIIVMVPIPRQAVLLLSARMTKDCEQGLYVMKVSLQGNICLVHPLSIMTLNSCRFESNVDSLR